MRIGWIIEGDIYIEPTTAFEVVQTAARNAGEAFAISNHTLRRRLHEKNLLASTDKTRDTLTVRRTLDSSNKKVFHFRRISILPDDVDDDHGGDND